jgi:integrase
MAVQFTGKFTKTFLDNPEDGTHTDRTGLYLFVSNDGKTRSWSFRRGGKRKTIGAARKVTLEQAQTRVQEFKAKFKAGNDPMAPMVKGSAWTYQMEADFYQAHKAQEEWGERTANGVGKSYFKKYVTDTPYKDEQLASMGVEEFVAIFKDTWNTTPEFARRAAYSIKEMIALAQIAEPPRYPPDKKNPIDLTKLGAFKRALGKQRSGKGRLGLEPEKVAKLVAFLWQPPMAHGDDECTTSEAAEVIGCSPATVLSGCRRHKKLTRRKLAAPYDHLNGTWVWKIAELEKIFPTFDRKKLKVRTEVDAYAWALLFTIYTGVRPEMATDLIWNDIKWDRGYIDFSKHKMKKRKPGSLYTIPLTPQIRKILEIQKQMQAREGIKPVDGEPARVFVHGYKPVGGYHFHGKGLVEHQLNLYLKRVLVLLDLVNGETDPKKMPCVSGFRQTFPEWASELSEADKYRQEFIEAQLGHDIKVNNKRYYKNVTYIGRRGAMMEDWEIYCDALRDTPVTPANLVELKRARSLVPAHSRLRKKEVNIRHANHSH